MVELLLVDGGQAAAWNGNGFTLSFMMSMTRIIETGLYGEAKLRVRAEVERRGLMRCIFHPIDVKRRIADGHLLAFGTDIHPILSARSTQVPDTARAPRRVRFGPRLCQNPVPALHGSVA